MSLSRSTRAMAVGTVASRGTGFLRTAVIASVLGVESVGAAYNVANTTPNIVYELLLGGVLTSVVVPLLVRAAQEDGDEGSAYAQRLLTLVALVLGTTAVVLVAAAPLSSTSTPATWIPRRASWRSSSRGTSCRRCCSTASARCSARC